MAKKKDNAGALAKSLTEELLSLMSVAGSVEVSSLPSETPDEEVISLNINTDAEAGLLIGAHGATLSAIQSFISISLKQKLDKWYQVVVDVGDWRQKQEEYLQGLARQASERAKATGEAQHLYNLTPSQRRVIHTYLTQDAEIQTESQGEGESRYLIVRLQK